MSKLSYIIKEIFSTLLTVAIMLLVVFGIQRYVVQPFLVDGHSMDYTLADGERIFMWKLGDVQRFDVVVLKAPDDPEKLHMKRVIGLPGDSIEMRDDQLYINGQALHEPYLEQKQSETVGNFTQDFTLDEITGETIVPEGKLFVMGDNRQNSLDSRRFGFINKDSVIGKATLVFWPLDRIEWLPEYEITPNGLEKK